MENIYIEILKIGRDKLDNGESTTYVEIEKSLIDKGFIELREDVGLQITVFRWSRKAFTFREFIEDSTDIDYLLGQDANKNWKERATIPVQIKKKMYLRAEAFLELMHYEALQEARSDSKKSIGIATKALFITSGLAIASIIIQLIAVLIDK